MILSRLAPLLVATALAVVPARAEGAPQLSPYAPHEAPHVDIVSPVVPQTWAYYSIQDKQFSWDSEQQTFSANLILTNAPYQAGDGDPIERQNAILPFPGVTYDATQQVFSAQDDKGRRIPMATGKPGATGNIQLLPTSRVSVFNFSGKLTVVLSGTTDQAFATNGPKWITENHGWYLQNLIQPSN